MSKEYNYTPTEYVTLFKLKSDLNNWIRFEPARAERYFNDRRTYVFQGLKSMDPDDAVIGCGRQAEHLFYQVALMEHPAESKEEFLDHVLPLKYKQKGQNLKEDNFFEDPAVRMSLENIAANEPLQSVKMGIVNHFQLSKEQIERLENNLSETIYLKIKDEIIDVFRANVMLKKIAVKKIQELEPHDAICWAILSDIELMTSNDNDDERPRAGGDYKHCTTFGYGEYLLNTALNPQLVYLLSEYRILIGDIYAWDENSAFEIGSIISEAVRKYVHGEVYVRLAAQRNENLMYDNQHVEEEVLSTMDYMAGEPDKKHSRNPYIVKRRIKEMPTGYYASGVFTAAVLALIKHAVVKDRIYAVTERLQGNAKASVDYSVFNSIRCEKEKLESRMQEMKESLKRKQNQIETLNRQLKDKNAELNNLKKEKLLPTEKAKPSHGKEQELLHEQIGQLLEENKELKKKNTEQIAKTKSMQNALNSYRERKQDNGILSKGTEEELYEGEFCEHLTEILAKERQACREGTRRADIVNSLLEANPYEDRLKKRRENIKLILRGNRDVTDRLKLQLKGEGLRLESENGKHAKFSYYGDTRYIATLGKTGSDHRTGINNANTIIELMM